ATRACPFVVEQLSAAHSVHSLPRLRGRDREGACKEIEAARPMTSSRRAKTHVRALTPSPTLPRKRGGSRASLPLADSIPDENALKRVTVTAESGSGTAWCARAADG